jgi:GNAT superfamily N-acetyltransferase
MSVTIRTATLADADALAALNLEAYPELIQDGVVFAPADLRAHAARFPAGQLVAEADGELVGGIASLILPRSIDALAPHTWIGVTDHGTFERHDPTGDTLYLADIYVAARAWGRGVGRALYAELFALCRRLGTSRVVGGGRLYSYVDAPADLTAEAYIAGVVRGELRDRVLESQLRAGFQVRGVLRGYLHDWRSRHCASLIVWDNPDRELCTTAAAEPTPARHGIW